MYGLQPFDSTFEETELMPHKTITAAATTANRHAYERMIYISGGGGTAIYGLYKYVPL